MSKVIAVLGNTGSGKSMFSCILAKMLTNEKQKAIIINADNCTPMFPVWLPEQVIKSNSSIGQLLSEAELSAALVASKVIILKSHPFIGLMGYVNNENPSSYPNLKQDMMIPLIATAACLVDFVILDCSSDMLNRFTSACIEHADVVIQILTPDLKGISYFSSHQEFFGCTHPKKSEYFALAGMARPFHAVKEIGHLIGGFDGLLPYIKEIDRCAAEGKMFEAIEYCSSKYLSSIDNVLEVVQ